MSKYHFILKNNLMRKCGWIVDGDGLFGYIRLQSYIANKKIKDYTRENIGWLDYGTLFRIKRVWKMYDITKSKLDDAFGHDPVYLKLYKWKLNNTKNKNWLVIKKKNSIIKLHKGRKKKNESYSASN